MPTAVPTDCHLVVRPGMCPARMRGTADEPDTHRDLSGHVRPDPPRPPRRDPACDHAGRSPGRRRGDQRRQGPALHPGRTHPDGGDRHQRADGRQRPQRGGDRGQAVPVAADGLRARERRRHGDPRPACRVGLRVRVPDGGEQQAHLPAHRDRVPDGFRDQPVHLLALRQGDPQFGWRRLELRHPRRPDHAGRQARTDSAGIA